MAKEYDATTKYLLEHHPRDLLAFAGLPAEDYRVEAIDADVSTVSASADKILRVHAPEPFLAHFEAQSGPDQTVDERILYYSVLMGWRHQLRVMSVLLLLRREANLLKLTGRLEYRLPDGSAYLTFHYQVIRVWEIPVAEVLAGGLGVLPLAPISDVAQSELPDVIARMKARIDAEAAPQDAAELWTATQILMGLRYSEALAEQLLKGVQDMEDSVTYQAILRKGEQKGEQKGRQEGRQEGELDEARRMCLLIGSKRLGDPDETTRARIEALMTREAIEGLTERLLEVENWSELFAA